LIQNKFFYGRTGPLGAELSKIRHSQTGKIRVFETVEICFSDEDDQTNRNSENTSHFSQRLDWLIRRLVSKNLRKREVQRNKSLVRINFGARRNHKYSERFGRQVLFAV